ncbi:MAG: hypothetical protein GY729_12500 [Desulfobacteraceae bacterium]|nr:hypothetical protein [Desulfobacteraceae bacterium]
MNLFKYVTILFLLPLITSCIALDGSDLFSKQEKEVKRIENEIAQTKENTQKGKENVWFHDASFGSVKVVDKKRANRNAPWLQRTITLKVIEPVSAKQIVNMLRGKNLNMTSSLPLDSYMYSGFGVTDVPIETAVQILFGSMGLDYEIDYDNKAISVLPMKWKTYYVNVGNRTASYSTGTGGSDSGSSSSSSSSSSSDSSDSESGTSVDTDTLDTGETFSIQAKNEFWKSLNDSVTQRLKILVPQSQVIGDDSDGAGTELYQEVTIGKFALNPEIGSIQIQAPRHVQKEMKAYINRVNNMYNAQIKFTGKLFAMTLDDNETRGFDINIFKEIAELNGYNFLFQNNALGGVTISPNGNITLGNPTAGNNGLFGVSKPQSFEMFHAFLSELSNVAVLQEPVLSTSSGIPAKFQKFETKYYNTYSQTSSSGDSGVAVATSNELVPVQFGTILSINPYLDIDKGMVRAQISWEQSLQSGVQTINQVISETDGSSRDIPIEIPNVTEATYSGEALLKDGDMIIIGGQKETFSRLDDSGTTGLKDSFLSPFVSKKKYTNQDVVYYFALHMQVVKI